MKASLSHDSPFRLSCALLTLGPLLLLTGCYATGEAYGPGPGPAVFVGPDDYLYYPGYETYYSTRHHRYVYRDHDRWVTRPEPPHGWVQGSPSVRMNFHDAPDRHHAEVVRQYPKTWRPPPQPARGGHDRDDRRDRDEEHH